MIDNDLNLLKLIKVLSEEKQTVLAAKKLKISQPTVSAMLKKLRNDFDDQLFIRNNNELEPTKRCEEILAELPDIFDKLESLYINPKPWDISQAKGEVQLFLPSPLIDIIAPVLVKKLCINAPNLTVECSIWTDSTPRYLEQNSNAWGVCYQPVKGNKNLIENFLYEDRFMLVMKQEHPIQNNTLEEVSRFPICVTIIPGFSQGSRMEMFISRYKIDKAVSARLSNMRVMFELIQQSDFIGSTSRLHKNVLPEGFRTMAMPNEIDPRVLNKNLSFYSSQRNQSNPLTKWLRSEITSIIEDLK